MAVAGALVVRGAMLAKIESTYGTDPTPDATDAILIEAGPLPFKIKADNHARRSVRTQPISEPHVIGARAWEINFRTELKNGGTAGTPTTLGELFQAAGLKETDTASDDTYKPDVTDKKSVTLWYYEDGQLYEANGVRFSSLKIGAKVGERVMCEFAGMGLYVAPIDASVVASPTPDTTEPPVFAGASFTYNGFSLTARSFEIEINTGLAERRSAAAATGYAGFQITAFEMKGKITCEAELVADQPWVANYIAADNAVLDMTIGSTAGNKIDIDAPRCRVESVDFGEDGGIRTVDIGFTMHDSAVGTFGDALAIKLY